MSVRGTTQLWDMKSEIWVTGTDKRYVAAEPPEFLKSLPHWLRTRAKLTPLMRSSQPSNAISAEILEVVSSSPCFMQASKFSKAFATCGLAPGLLLRDIEVFSH